MTVETFEELIPNLAPSAFVHPQALVVGDVTMGEESSIWPMSVARGDIHRIRIGARTNIQDLSMLHVTHAGFDNADGFPLTIGDDVTVGHHVVLHGCTIGNRVLVGIGAIVLDGAVVEDETIIGGGSLVPPGKVLESGYMWMGAPAKKIRPLTDQERARFLPQAQGYVQMAKRYRVNAQR